MNNPLPCGCRVQYRFWDGGGIIDGSGYIVHCPLHAAAEQLAYGSWLVSFLCKVSGEPVDGFRFREGVHKIRAALDMIPNLLEILGPLARAETPR